MSSVSTATVPQAATDHGLAPGASARLTFVAGFVAVLVAYSIPLLLGLVQSGQAPRLLFEDEVMYAVRVLDAYRGGNLSNPYLAGHERAPRYMPGLAERTIAFAARTAHIPPLTAIALSRLAIPLLMFALLWLSARVMGLALPGALLAALLPVLALSTRVVNLHFLRYLRIVSPGANLLVLLIALYFWLRAFRNPTIAADALAGVSTAALFYTPPYYWIFLIAGALALTLSSAAPLRRHFLLALVIAFVLGAPALWNSITLSRLPEVQQTLQRIDLMTPGRTPDPFVLRHFCLAVICVAILWLGRRRLGGNATFLLAFFVSGTLLLVQNVVTNRRLQSDHWIECLIPVAALAFAALLSGNGATRTSPRLISAAIVVLFAAAITAQTISYFRWKATAERDPLNGVIPWLLDRRMPETLAWLDAHTPPRSIVVTQFADVLPMFTHNTVYFGYYASHHVLSDSEFAARSRDFNWTPARPTPLLYPADYFLGLDSQCAPSPFPVLYRNPAERTCVLDLRAPHGLPGSTSHQSPITDHPSPTPPTPP